MGTLKMGFTINKNRIYEKKNACEKKRFVQQLRNSDH